MTSTKGREKPSSASSPAATVISVGPFTRVLNDDTPADRKARAVSHSLFKQLFTSGSYAFAATPRRGSNAVAPAGSDQGNALDLRAGFAGLAIQAIGFERGAEKPRVHVYVVKGSPSALKKLSMEHDGVQVVVNRIGNLTIKPEAAAAVTNHGRQYLRNTRVCCGSSCAPGGEFYSGTVGALVRVPGQSGLFALSNNHVFAACNHVLAGTPIVSPAHGDITADHPPRTIAQHYGIVELRSGDPAFVPPCQADAAIAQVLDPNAVTSWQGDSDTGYDTPSQVIKPSNGMKVKKFGRTTRLTTGIIESVVPDLLPLPYKYKKFAATVYFEDVWTVRGGQDRFALPGDSGSLVVTEDGSSAVGIVFAAGINDNYGVIIPIDRVLSLFGGGLTLVSKHGV